MTTLSVEQAIAQVPMWADKAHSVQCAVLSGGITNHNYRIDTNDESFVLRLGGANTHLLGIKREHEHAATLAAAGLGIAPEVIYFIRPQGYLVTRFVPGRPLPPEEMGQPNNIRRVAEVLRQIHALPPIPATFSPFRVVEEYTRIARQYGVTTFPANFDWLLARKGEIEAALQQTSPVFETFGVNPVALCHNDLLNENFLDDGRIRILDWEYAGMGDPFFDLANFAVHHGFNDDQDAILLESYFGQSTPALHNRLNLMKIMSDFREAMWGVVQQGLSSLDFDFEAYANKHFSRMEAAMRG